MIKATKIYIIIPVRDDMHMISYIPLWEIDLMKKLMIASACGLMLFAACVFAGDTKVEPKVAGSGMYFHVKIWNFLFVKEFFSYSKYFDAL